MSDLENGYCPLNGHGLYGGSDRPCPWCMADYLRTRVGEYEFYLEQHPRNLMNVWRTAEAKLEAVQGSIQAKRKDGWEGFRNVIYGWCVPLKQINTFFDELEALLEQTK